ncbi:MULTISPECIES: hypothetical protein [unclassified Streptomyces]|uniref:hypothetical protein n=1 Tax=unclassified Streptomyces TaxID=2593676 RepID=UPI001CB6DFD6|nr:MULTISPECIES: hypothetical protein [unclassified Streptomyces]
MIAAVGHEDLPPDTLALVERELRVRMERYGDPAPGLVRAGPGLPAAFGRAVRAAGRRLVVVLPVRGAVPAEPPPGEPAPAREVADLADEVRLLPYDPADRDSRVRADEALVARSERLLAVWDGSPTNGRDATAHMVAYARAHGVRVEVVWPVGAVRGAPGEPLPEPVLPRPRKGHDDHRPA